MEIRCTQRAGDAGSRPRAAPSAFSIGHRIERLSEPMRIRGYEWRLVLYWGRGCVLDGERLVETTRLLVGYEWRYGGGFGDGPWQRDVDWPRYDSNNGQTAGLPRSLRKLWERCPWAHRDAIERRMAEEAGEGVRWAT